MWPWAPDPDIPPSGNPIRWASAGPPDEEMSEASVVLKLSLLTLLSRSREAREARRRFHTDDGGSWGENCVGGNSPKPRKRKEMDQEGEE